MDGHNVSVFVNVNKYDYMRHFGKSASSYLLEALKDKLLKDGFVEADTKELMNSQKTEKLNSEIYSIPKNSNNKIFTGERFIYYKSKKYSVYLMKSIFPQNPYALHVNQVYKNNSRGECLVKIFRNKIGIDANTAASISSLDGASLMQFLQKKKNGLIPDLENV